MHATEFCPHDIFALNIPILPLWFILALRVWLVFEAYFPYRILFL